MDKHVLILTMLAYGLPLCFTTTAQATSLSGTSHHETFLNNHRSRNHMQEEAEKLLEHFKVKDKMPEVTFPDFYKEQKKIDKKRFDKAQSSFTQEAKASKSNVDMNGPVAIRIFLLSLRGTK